MEEFLGLNVVELGSMLAGIGVFAVGLVFAFANREAKKTHPRRIHSRRSRHTK